MALAAALLAPSLAPHPALAMDAPSLQMPTSGSQLASMVGISAPSYVVANVSTGQVLISKNADQTWAPASLTKLVTALVVLDTKPTLSKAVAMTAYDQTLGACSSGGECIKTAPGVKFTVDGLFHAALLPSANNAASALAQSTGMTQDQFVAKMNAKAKALGATSSHFNEPTGMDPTNVITAADYSKIVAAAFSNPYLAKIAAIPTFALNSTNNAKYNQTIKNTDKLLSSSSVQMLGAKTGYLGTTYNFASVLKYKNGPEVSVVLLGENHLYTAFDETAELASLAQLAESLNSTSGTVSTSSVN